MKARSATSRELIQKRSDAVSLGIVAAHITFVLVPVYLAAAIGPCVLAILLWLWFGLTAHGLLNLMHECAHCHVFKRRWGSDVLGRWVLAPLAFADFDNYRQLHWAHHQHLGGTDDPKYSYKIDIRGLRLPSFFVQCMVGLEALKKLHYQNRERAGTELRASGFWLVRLVVFHGILIATLFAIAWRFGPHDAEAVLLRLAIAYLFVYAYGLVSLTLFIATLRAIAEHQDGGDPVKIVGQAALRNLSCGPIGRLIFGCYGFAEHATHHLQPALPSYRLHDATFQRLNEAPWLKPQIGYIGILMRQVHPKNRRIGLQDA